MSNIGVIEICVKEHYMVVNAIVKTYASDPNNNVFVFTTLETKKLLVAQGNDESRIQYVLLEESEHISDYFVRIKSYRLDRIHYTTVYKHYKYFCEFVPNYGCQIFFHFHNVDKWFLSAWIIQLKRLWKFVLVDRSVANILYQFKVSVRDLYWDHYRKKLIKKMSQDGTRFILLSEAQKFHVSKYLNVERSVVFPTLIYEPSLYKDLSGENIKIRVCIPGLVDQNKKEYGKLLDLLEANMAFYKTNYVFDLLGFLPPKEKRLIQRVKKLREMGLEIFSYEFFIDVAVFDTELYKCDIILSNILMDHTEEIQRKETAAVFHMIRGAKPGIFPVKFILDDVFNDSVVKFVDYIDLHNFFVNLTNSSSELKRLKEYAREASLQNSPSLLIKKLI